MEQIGKENLKPNSWIIAKRPACLVHSYKAEYLWIYLNKHRTPAYVLEFTYYPKRFDETGALQAYKDPHVNAYFGRVDPAMLDVMSEGKITLNYSVTKIAEGSKKEVDKVIRGKKLEMPENADANWETLSILLDQELNMGHRI
jgi:hypothetical protein